MQVALSNLVGINNKGEEVLSRVNASVIEGRSCKLVAGRHTVCFFPCMRYNYCHTDQSCCTDAKRLPVSLTTLDELMSARIKVPPVSQDACCQLWCFSPCFALLDEFMLTHQACICAMMQRSYDLPGCVHH